MLSACAGITVKPVENEKQVDGFRYYEMAPFLFIHTDGKAGVSSEIVWLPDQTRKMSIHPYSILASNNTTLKFNNGMLTESSATVDETVVPNAILTALAAAAKVLPFKAGPQPAPTPSIATGQVPVPYLYKISVNAKGEVILSGGSPPININATVLMQGG